MRSSMVPSLNSQRLTTRGSINALAHPSKSERFAGVSAGADKPMSRALVNGPAAALPLGTSAAGADVAKTGTMRCTAGAGGGKSGGGIDGGA